MKETLKHDFITLALFEFRENIRNRWLLVYGFSFLIFSSLILYMGGTDPLQASASLMNLVLLLVPLFSLVFGSISFSDSLSFQEVLIAQPLRRSDVFLGKWLGLGSGLALSYVAGMGLGSLFGMNLFQKGLQSYALLLLLGALLSFIFLSLSFYIVQLVRKREMVFGLILLIWFFFFILYDLLVMGSVLIWGDYPLEWPLFILTFINPIDLTRILLLLQNDLSAMMGYSGALFQKYLGSSWGILIGSLALLLWIVIPAWLGMRAFRKRDL